MSSERDTIHLTPYQLKRLQRAVRRLVRCSVDHSWKGGGDPADIPRIEADLFKAKIALNALFTIA